MNDFIRPWERNEWYVCEDYPGVRMNILQRFADNGDLEVLVKATGGTPQQQKEAYDNIVDKITKEKESQGGKLLCHMSLPI